MENRPPPPAPAGGRRARAGRPAPAPQRWPDPLAAVRGPADPPHDVYLTGTVFLDIIFTGLEAAPVRGTESWARGMGSSPGGVANMATALARLGLRTSLAAAFGDDKYGEYCWETLRDGEGIDLSFSRTAPGWHSPVTVSMAYEGERTMVSHGHRAPPPEPAPGAFPAALSGVSCLEPGRPQPWIGEAAGRGSRIFADVGWDDSGRWELAALPDLEHCEAFLPNAGEAMRYARADCPRQAARRLADRVPLVVVTMGGQGAYAADGRTGETAEVPALAVEALDTTGAGDVFVAGFLTGTLAGWPLAERLAFAGLTAALSVKEFGGSLSAPGWPEILAWRRQAAADGGPPGPYGELPGFLDSLPADGGTPPPPGPKTRSSGRRLRAVPTLGFRGRP